MGPCLRSLQLWSWYVSHVEEKTDFSMYDLVLQTEMEYQQVTETEKEEAVVLTVLQKVIGQLIEGTIEFLNKREDRYIKKRDLVDREGKLLKR